MNPRAILAIVAACLLVAPVAFAQTTPAQTPPVKIHKGKKAKAAMPGMAELKAAEASLHSALPIYDGFRVRAEKLIKRAHKAAMTGSTAAALTAEPKMKWPKVQSEGHDTSKYGAPAVDQSQADMKAALTSIQSAMTAMGATSTVVTADLNQAISDINAGIALHTH